MALKNEQEYEDILKRITEMLDTPDISLVGQELLDLLKQVEQYEAVHYPIQTSLLDRKIRCQIIDVDGEFLYPRVVAKTPEISRAHVGKYGYAERENDTYRITLDDGTILMGYECWWQPTDGEEKNERNVD